MPRLPARLPAPLLTLCRNQVREKEVEGRPERSSSFGGLSRLVRLARQESDVRDARDKPEAAEYAQLGLSRRESASLTLPQQPTFGSEASELSEERQHGRPLCRGQFGGPVAVWNPSEHPPHPLAVQDRQQTGHFQGVVQNLATVEASAAVTLGTGLRLVPNGGANHFDGVSCLLRLAFKD